MAGHRNKPDEPRSDSWDTEDWPYPASVPHAVEGGESTWEAWHEAARQLDEAFAPTQPSDLVPLTAGRDSESPHPHPHPLTAEAVMVQARRYNRVCPHPGPWQRLYHALEGDRHEDLPPPPVQPWMWSKLSALQKRLHFRDHIEWAERHGKLALVANFMEALPESDWVHMGET